MAEVAPSARARRVEAVSGVLALFAGLVAIGVQLSVPRVEEVYFGYITYRSYWVAAHGYVTDPVGLAALGLCLLCLLAIGAGAYAHAVRRSARLGRLLLWCGTGLLALAVAFGLSPFVAWPSWVFTPPCTASRLGCCLPWSWRRWPRELQRTDVPIPCCSGGVKVASPRGRKDAGRWSVPGTTSLGR